MANGALVYFTDDFGIFAPGFVEARREHRARGKAGPSVHHHCVGNVAEGEMDSWGDFYGRVFGFLQLISFDDEDIATEYTALRSKVMTDSRHRVKFPINEPAQGKKKSEIQEYLIYCGARAHGPHVRYRCHDSRAPATCVEFLDTPDSYYDLLGERAICCFSDNTPPPA